MSKIKSVLKIVKGCGIFICVTFIGVFRLVRSPAKSFKWLYSISFYRNSAYLIANSGLSLFLGFIFNILIAHMYSASDVGYGSAIISVLNFLGFIGTLGFGYYIVRYLPAEHDKSGLLNSLITVGGITAAVACLLFLSGIAWWSPKLTFLLHKPYFFISFVIMGVIFTVYSIVAQVFVSFRKSGYILLGQGVIASVLELVLVIVMSAFGVYGIVASQGIGLAIALIACIFVFLPRIIPHYRPLAVIQLRTTRDTISYSFANYAVDGLTNLPFWIISLLVLNIYGAASNAYFYMAWTMSTVLLAIAYGISTSLFAEGAHEVRNVGGDIVRSLKLILLIVFPAAVLMIIFSPQLLLLYGGTYSAEGTQVLRLFSLSVLPASINLLYFSLARIENWLKSLVLLSGAMAVLTILGSVLLLPHFGIVGAGISRLIVQTVLLVFTVPKLFRRLKKRNQDIN
jgi:O-antigen/teichoic acid export membrane protein